MLFVQRNVKRSIRGFSGSGNTLVLQIRIMSSILVTSNEVLILVQEFLDSSRLTNNAYNLVDGRIKTGRLWR